MVTINRKTGTLCGLIAGTAYLAIPDEETKRYLAFFGAPALGYIIGRTSETLRRYREDSITDPLTGLHNSRYIQQRLQEAIYFNKRTKKPFGVMYIDVTKFKEVNDKKGHKAGDEYLKEIASLLKRTKRETDILGRIGGDEFVMLLQDANEYVMSVVKNKLIRNILAYNNRNPDKPKIRLSIGTETSTNVSNLERILEEADAKMFEDKKTYYDSKGENPRETTSSTP